MYSLTIIFHVFKHGPPNFRLNWVEGFKRSICGFNCTGRSAQNLRLPCLVTLVQASPVHLGWRYTRHGCLFQITCLVNAVASRKGESSPRPPFKSIFEYLLWTRSLRKNRWKSSSSFLLGWWILNHHFKTLPPRQESYRIKKSQCGQYEGAWDCVAKESWHKGQRPPRIPTAVT